MWRRRVGGGGGGGGGGGVKVAPNLASGWDREATRALNISVLRRLDPAVTDILTTAAHVVVYSFDEDVQEWVQCRSKTPLVRFPFLLQFRTLIGARRARLFAAGPEAGGGVALRRQEVCTAGAC
jgi:hypothetical protein